MTTPPNLDEILSGKPAAAPAPAAPPASPPQAATSPGDAPGDPPPAAPARITLELDGGVRQDVDPAELAKLWAKRTRIDALAAEADDRLTRVRGMEQLAKHLDSLPDDQAAAVLHAIHHPETLVSGNQRQQQPRQPRQQQGSDLEALLADVEGSQQSGGTQNPAIAALVDVVRRQAAQLQEVSQFVQGERQQRAQATLSQQVQAELNTYDVIRSVPGMDEFALTSAMGLVAQGKSPSDAAAQVAANAHKLAMKMKAAPPAMPRDPRAYEPTAFGHLEGINLGAPDKPFSADDLNSGRLSQELGRIFAGE